MQRILILVSGIAAALSALSVPAYAAARDDVLYGISRCGGIADDRTWLDCVYGAAQPMRAQLGLPPAPLTQQKLVPPAIGNMSPAAAVQSFAPRTAMAPPPPAERPGFFARLVTPSHENAEPPTRMASYKFDAAGHFTVTLANGETWEQDLGDGNVARWNRPAATYTVQIQPSSSSYHFLKVGSEQYMVNRE